MMLVPDVHWHDFHMPIQGGDSYHGSSNIGDHQISVFAAFDYCMVAVGYTTEKGVEIAVVAFVLVVAGQCCKTGFLFLFLRDFFCLDRVLLLGLLLRLFRLAGIAVDIAVGTVGGLDTVAAEGADIAAGGLGMVVAGVGQVGCSIGTVVCGHSLRGNSSVASFVDSVDLSQS